MTITTARRRSVGGQRPQVDAVERAPRRRSGRRTGSPAWRSWSCRRRWCRPARRSGRPARSRSRSGSTGTPSTYANRTSSKRSVAAGLGRARPGSVGSGTTGSSSRTPESFSSAADGRLEGVVELRDVLHRLEELAQVEQERRQHADGDLAVEGEVAAVEQDDADGDVADQPDAGHEQRDQPERDQVGGAVLVVDVVEDLLVARLAAERLDGADAVHRLDEVHDHQRDRLAGHAGSSWPTPCGTSWSSQARNGPQSSATRPSLTSR